MEVLIRESKAALLGIALLLFNLISHHPAHAQSLTSIDMTPANPNINIGQTQQFTATGTFSDSSTQILSSAATAVAAGDTHACVLLSDHTVKCWGNNGVGQLGNGTNSGPETCDFGGPNPCSTIPVSVSGISTATAIAAGFAYSCAVLSDGTVNCWGSNNFNKLGGGTALTFSTTPVPVIGINTATAVAAGDDHVCALLSDGTVHCWGHNQLGQLGNGGTINPSTPVQVNGINSATGIAAGGSHTCAIISGGSVECWGANNYGQLGNGTAAGPEICGSYFPCSTTPVMVSGITNAVALAAGDGHTCAVLSNGTVQCWGWNVYGQLGDGNTSDSLAPVSVSGISTATAIAAGFDYTCVVLGDGTARCWGFGGVGELGNGMTIISSTPVPVSGISNGAAVSAHASGELTCAILSDGTAKCWGWNDLGELGDGTSIGPELCFTDHPCSTIPVAVMGTSGVVWGSSNTGVASIDANGLAAALSLGTTTITATSGSVSGSTTLTVSPQTVTLTLTTAGTGTGVVSGAGTYSFGQIVSVSAVANAGSTFTGWTGINHSECNTGSVLMNADKSCTANFALISSLPDLIPSAISANATTVAPGKIIPLTYTVTNQGSGAAGSFKFAFHLSTDSSYGGGDDRAFPATVSVTSLASGASKTATIHLTVPSLTPVGTYYVCGMADSANTVAESNETNNSNCTGGTIQVTRADLIMTDVTPGAAEVNQGGTLSVTDTVMNQGLVSTFSGFKIGFFLHPDAGADAPVNTTQPEAALAAGASRTGTVNLAILASTPPNEYHLCAKADSGNTVIETDDTNNIFCSAATVEVPEPDLIVNAISMTATTVKAGATVPVSNAITNQGGSKAGSFVVAFHLSTDATYGGGDDHVSITTRTVSALAIGGTNAGTTYVRVPADTPPGDYHICANADDGGSVAEGDEGNNSACTATTVTVPEPDLVISGLSKSGSSVAAGGTFTISNTVKNQGGSQAAASEVGFVLSTDFVIGNGDDIPLTPNRPVAVLGVNATSAASTVVTVPGGTTPGVYHVGAIADVNGAVSESNEGNNNRLASGTIMVTP